MGNSIVVFVHLLGAIALVGGVHYAVIVHLPLARRMTLPPEFVAASGRRLRALLWAGAALMILSGLHLLGIRMKPGIEHLGRQVWEKVGAGSIAAILAIVAGFLAPGGKGQRIALALFLVVALASVFAGQRLV